MRNLLNEKILEEANTWIKSKEKVVLATVIQTWGSSPLQTGSKMIIKESINLIKSKKNFKKLEFEVSNENAWNIGLACGGKIQIFIEQIN